MSVRVLIGPAGSGKTHRCMEALRARERQGKRALLIVPDQFTYAADRLLLDDPTLAGVRHVRVMSFGRLAHQQATGAEPILSEQGRRLLLRRVLHQADPEALGPLRGVRGALGLVDVLAGTVKEIKGIAGADAAARLAAAGGDSAKAVAVSHLIASYDAELARVRHLDPEEWIHQAAAHLARTGGGWAGEMVWVDGFASFTPAEKCLLEALAAVAGELTVTLCADAEEAAHILAGADEAARAGLSPTSNEFLVRWRCRLSRPAFLPTLRTLLYLSERLPGSVKLDPIPSTSPPRFTPRSALADLEALLFRTAESAPPRPRGPRLRCAPHPYHEVLGWARAVDRWTRLDPEPIRYRDVAILIRDLERYRPLVLEIFRRFGIPVFIDERRDVTAHPAVRLAVGALALASSGWTREAVLDVLRNPLLGLAPGSVDRIENLALEYGIEYERWWQTDWRVPPLPGREVEEDGADPEPSDRTGRRRQLAAAEARAAMARVLGPLRTFTTTWDAGEIGFPEGAEALRRLLDTFGATEARGFPTWSEEETRRIAELLLETLHTGCELLGDPPVTAALFTRLLKDALASSTLGLTPRSLDAVTVAEPRRSRVNEVRRVILGGLDAESFPQAHTQDPLFGDAEREQLAAGGMPLVSPVAVQVEEDPYLFYIACTRAREALHLTYASDASREASPYLLEVEPEVEEPEACGLPDCQRPVEIATALTDTLRALPSEARDGFAEQVRGHLPGATEAIGRAVHCLGRIEAPLADRIDPDLVAAVFPGGTLEASASRLQTFSECPFKHFAQRMLLLEPRPRPTLSPLSTGSAAHEALHRFFTERTKAREPAEDLSCIREIFRSLAGEEAFRIFQSDPPSAYRWSRTGHNLELFVRNELRRLRQSAFRPRALELAFGLPPDETAAPRTAHLGDRDLDLDRLPPLEIPVEAGGKTWRVQLRGRIDRLDIAEGPDGRLQAVVIDYKQGSARRSLARDLDLGLSLQAAAYLMAVEEILGLVPAGCFYYSLRPRTWEAGSRPDDANPQRFTLRGFFAPETRNRIDPEGAFLGARPSGRVDMPSLLDRVRTQIAHLASGILEGSIRPYPAGTISNLPCRFCDYDTVCRFDRRRHPVRQEVRDDRA